MPRLMIMTGYWSDHCQAGKRTLLNCLAAAIPGGERVLSGEEVFELQLPPGVGTCSKTRWAGGASKRRGGDPCHQAEEGRRAAR